MTAVELHHGAATDVGLVRQTNEDALLVAPPVFVVADGMGGHSAGEVASAIAVEEFGRRFSERDDERFDQTGGMDAILSALSRSQTRLRAYAEAQPNQAGRIHAGTTVVAALALWVGGSPRWLLANLGDSRAYQFSNGELTLLTTDHSVVQELIERGEISEAEAAVHPERHVITRALGAALDAPQPDFSVVPMTDSQRLLLCSDGVNAMIDADEISAVLMAHRDPQTAAEELVAAALEAGGRDNATAVVIDVIGLVTRPGR